MRIYLDTCAWKRPYDEPSSERVVLEGLAVAAVLRRCQIGVLEVVSSAALQAENSRNPDPTRRAEVAAMLARLPTSVPLTKSMTTRARELVSLGLRPLDALHTASAEAAGCTYLVTTDDRMLRRLRANVAALHLSPIDPLGLVRVLEGLEE